MAWTTKMSGLPLFRAFRSSNYTLYFVGRAVSQFGTWMQRTAVLWVVYSITKSTFMTGVAVFAEQFPSFLFSIFGGVAADRYDRYKVIKITQIASMIQSVMLAALMFTGHAPVWAILVLSVILGIINAFDVPARQALVHDVVADPADLPNALSLTTATAGLAQLGGATLSGIVISAFGSAVCFLINAASFGGVLVSLLLMKLPVHARKKSEKKVMAEFAEGFAYLKQKPDIGVIILIVAVISFLVLPYSTVLPEFAKVIYKGNAKTFGYLTGFVSVGAIVGTIYLASRKPGAHLKRILFLSTIIMGIGLIFFSQLKNFPVAMFFAALIGFGGMAQFTVCNIYVQSHSSSQMRGRVIGIMLMAIFGMLPIGSVIIGFVALHTGAPVTVLGEGVIALVVALLFAKFLTTREDSGKPEDAASNRQ